MTERQLLEQGTRHSNKQKTKQRTEQETKKQIKPLFLKQNMKMRKKDKTFWILKLAENAVVTERKTEKETVRKNPSLTHATE